MKCICGKDKPNPKNKFCSQSCATTHTNKWARKKSVIHCLHCNEPVVDAKGHRSKNSVLCLIHKSLGLKPRRTRAQKRAVKNEAWIRYQAKKKNQTPADVDLKALQQIYLNCPPGHEVDHIIPISKGGLHSPENLQYLTISENRRKSNKIVGRP